MRRARRAGHSVRAASCGAWLAANADLDRLDAQLLVAHVLGVGRSRILAHPETDLTMAQVRHLNGLADRRRKREPLAHILGQKEFFGLNFRLHPTVLVPRPETERLVELALGLAPRGGRLIDLGTGSGCVAVAIKTHRPDLEVTATDVSRAALAMASANAEAHAAEIAFVRGDWLAPLAGPFDCIVANPPYIARHDPALANLNREPQLALVAGADGFDAIDRIISQAPGRMGAGTCLLLEHGCGQAAAVRSALVRQGFLNIQTHTDLAGLDRVTVARAQQ